LFRIFQKGGCIVNETLGLNTLALYGAGAGALLVGLKKVKQRAELSLAKHGSLAGHPRNARRIAALLPSYSYSEAHVFGLDGAPEDVILRRRIAFDGLVEQLQTRFKKSLQASTDVAGKLSDLQFVRRPRA
jgi:glutamate-1-semialdehyde 2,1-aminomutase